MRNKHRKHEEEGGQGGQPSLAKQVVMGGMEVMSSVEQGGRVMSSAEQGAEQSPKWGRVGGWEIGRRRHLGEMGQDAV